MEPTTKTYPIRLIFATADNSVHRLVIIYEREDGSAATCIANLNGGGNFDKICFIDEDESRLVFSVTEEMKGVMAKRPEIVHTLESIFIRRDHQAHLIAP